MKRTKSRKALVQVTYLWWYRDVLKREQTSLTRSLNAILESEEMPYSPRHFFPRNGEEASDAGEDVQSCSIYVG